MMSLSGIALVASRRNIGAERAARAEWKLAHSEDHPLRYRLHDRVRIFQDESGRTRTEICLEGAYNLSTGRAGLIAEIRETKPVRIERIPQKGDEMRLATVPEHLAFLGELKAWEIADL